MAFIATAGYHLNYDDDRPSSDAGQQQTADENWNHSVRRRVEPSLAISSYYILTHYYCNKSIFNSMTLIFS